MDKTIYLETMGCQMNALDSELVLGELLAAGYRPTDDMVSASLVIINTCSVRQHAEDKVYSRLGQLGGRVARPAGQVVAVIGCMPEREADRLLGASPRVDILCGPSELHRLPGLIADVEAGRTPVVALSGRLQDRSTAAWHAGEHADLESLDSSRAYAVGVHAATPKVFGPAQAYVRITRGCNKRCSFCVVPYTRGPEVHRPPDHIVADVKRLADSGVVEVTLLGQTVNHYKHRDDGGGRQTSFAELLHRVHEEVPHLPRLRFVTSFPRDFGDDVLQVVAACRRICRYLHLPAQSGSNAVLRRMNRGYTVEQYKELLDRARTSIPDVSIAGDMIVGFSGETEDDFRQSLDLLRIAKYKNCFIFKYSARPGTPAAERHPDDVSDAVKRRRNNDMLAIQAEINQANHQALIGRTLHIFVEGPSKSAMKQSTAARSEVADDGTSAGGAGGETGQLVGRTEGDQIVVFNGSRDHVGRLVDVRISSATAYTLFGKLVSGQ
jgi:tRNA-2-methylthio-N6-dimethylallyladenosine synthase